VSCAVERGCSLLGHGATAAKLTCVGSRTCDLSCDQGGSCEIDCESAGTCALRCASDSACLVRCGGKASACTVDCQGGKKKDCPQAGVFTCNRDCPP
jgi:hypothetical protein